MIPQNLSPRLTWGKTVTLMRWALGVLLIWTGLSKLQQPYDFLNAVYSYELVGPQTGLWLAIIVPWLEAIIGITLVFGVWLRGGALLAVALFCLFTVAQASVAADGLKIPCGCAIGNAPEYTSHWKTVESGVLLVAAGLVFVGCLTLSPTADSRTANSTVCLPKEPHG